jgi:hypothetical protein
VAALEEKIRVNLTALTVPGRQTLQEIRDTIKVRGRTLIPQKEEPVTDELAEDI